VVTPGPIENLREGCLANSLWEREEVVLNRIWNYKVAEVPREFASSEKEHGGTALIAPKLRGTGQEPRDDRLTPKDPVASAKLEVVTIALV
jgi:hypothetical protein